MFLDCLSTDGMLKVPDIKFIMQLRCLPDGGINENYLYFCEKFLKCVVGMAKFNRSCKEGMLLTSFVTESDEAFSLLLLENSEQRWKRYHERCCQGKENRRGGDSEEDTGNKKNKDKNNVPTKYTTLGVGGTYKGYTKKNNGWTMEGIQRFNAIHMQVHKDRVDHGDVFDKAFKNYLRRAHQQGENNNRGKATVDAVLIRAANDLFSTDETEKTVEVASSNNTRLDEEPCYYQEDSGDGTSDFPGDIVEL